MNRSIPSGTPDAAATASHENPVAAASPTELENCDECGRIQLIRQLWRTRDYGLLCDRCVDEIRNQGLHQ